MKTPQQPANEQSRLDSLQSLGVLDTEPEARFDRLTTIASLAFGVPMCLVSLVDSDRQWFKSKVGLDASETPRDISFCGHAILRAEPLIVPDALADSRFSDNPLVCGPPHIRFYAGQPLDDGRGHRLGTLCLIDTEPRTLSDDDVTLLEELGRMVEIELTSIGLEASNELHGSVIASLEEGVLVVAADGTVEEANESASLIVGLPVDAVVGRNMADLASIPEFQFVDTEGEQLDAEARPLMRTLLFGESTSGQIMGLRRVDGTVTWLSVNSHVIGELVDGRPRRAVLSFEDVTDRLEVDRMKDEFVSVVSHELRTPLTSIRGALGLLASGNMGALDDGAQSMLDIAVSNTDRLIRLINDILDIERMQARQVAMMPRDVDLDQLLREAASVMRPMADDAGVQLDGGTPVRAAWADPDRLLQTLTNLISNAIKFSPEGGVVSVRAVPDGDGVIVHVRDSGRGIPPDKVDHVFGRFKQVDATDSREKGGTGLGLAICKEIVEQHGGQIWVTSRLGEGSTFSFSLPAKARPSVVEAADETEPSVLLVEDDRDLAEVMGQMLRASGARVGHATTAEDAIRQGSESPPDVMVLDLGLPDADGFAVVDAMRRHDVLRETALVIYSARDLSQPDRDRLRLGPTDFFTKAVVPPDSVSSHIARMLGVTDRGSPSSN